MTRPRRLLVPIATAVSAALLAQHANAQRVPVRTDGGIEEIVVTADPLRRGSDSISQAVTVLTGSALQLRPLTTVGELLDGLPGISNADFGPGVGRPVIRGLQGSRVRTLEDGMPTADVAGEGADHAIGIDPARARQVEVYRGPATLLYGNGAAGGVVNVRTQRFDPNFGEGPRARGGLTYGENGNERQGYLGVELPTSENFVLRADGSLRRTDDFDIKGFQQIGQTAGRRNRLVNSSVETDSYSLSGLWRGDWGYLGVGVSTWETDYGIPENFDARPRDLGGQADEFERIFAEYDRFDLRGELFQPLPGFKTARFAMSYTQFEQQEVEFEFERTPAGGELDEKVVEAAFENDELELRLELEHEEINGWRGVVGFQFNDRDFTAGVPDDDEENFYVRPNRTRSAGLFVLEQRDMSWGQLELSARIERQRSRPDDIAESEVDGVTGINGGFIDFPFTVGNESNTTFSLSAGGVYDLNAEHHLLFSVTRAERAPAPEQLFAFGRHAAAGTFEVGDLGLDKETYLNFDVGVERHAGLFRYEARLFYNRIDDFIFLQSVDDGSGNPVFVNDIGNRAGEGAAIGCMSGDGGLCRLRNQLVFNEQANAAFYGGEFSAVADLITGPQSLSLRFSGDHVRGKLRSGDSLPRITPSRLGIGLDAATGDLRLSVDYRRVFRQNKIGVAEDVTSSFNLLSLNASWSPEMLAGGEFFVQGRNLLNEDGRLHQSFFRDEAPIIGRAFFAGIRFDIGG